MPLPPKVRVWCSTQASLPLEIVANAYLSEKRRGPLWFQLYMQPDRSFTRELIQRAESAGLKPWSTTVDAPSSGAVTVNDGRDSGYAGSVFRRQSDGHEQPAPDGASPRPKRACSTACSPRDTWSDLEWLKANARLPILLKGILHEKDALQAAALGMAGVIVSNHGGRTLDTAPATAHVLPRIIQTVAGEMPVLVDGGIRRGTDILKAMALGASAMLVGRPYIYGLATMLAHSAWRTCCDCCVMNSKFLTGAVRLRDTGAGQARTSFSTELTD